MTFAIIDDFFGNRLGSRPPVSVTALSLVRSLGSVDQPQASTLGTLLRWLDPVNRPQPSMRWLPANSRLRPLLHAPGFVNQPQASSALWLPAEGKPGRPTPVALWFSGQSNRALNFNDTGPYFVVFQFGNLENLN